MFARNEMDPIVEELLTCVSWICFIPELMSAKVDLKLAVLNHFRKTATLDPSKGKTQKHRL